MRTLTLKLAIPFVISMVAITQPSLADEHKNFHCSSFPFLSDKAKSSIDGLSHNRTMKKIVKEYAYQWENEEMRRTCKAAAAGGTANFSCIDGRRDWNAIASKIPQELTSMDRKSLRPHQLKLQELGSNGRLRNEALNYCKDLGVIDRNVKG